MRQNARFRSSWEPGGDLITLTVRVAAAAVVNGVIGHCRPSQIKAVQVAVTLRLSMGEPELYPLAVLNGTSRTFFPANPRGLADFC